MQGSQAPRWALEADKEASLYTGSCPWVGSNHWARQMGVMHFPGSFPGTMYCQWAAWGHGEAAQPF